METGVQVTGITAEPKGEASKAYVTYHGVKEGIPKVLEVTLLADGSVKEAKTYALMADTKESMTINAVHHSENVFMFGGASNYLEDSSSGFGTLKVDWIENEEQFGFFGVFSAKDKCTDTAKLPYGPRKSKSISSSSVSQ